MKAGKDGLPRASDILQGISHSFTDQNSSVFVGKIEGVIGTSMDSNMIFSIQETDRQHHTMPNVTTQSAVTSETGRNNPAPVNDYQEQPIRIDSEEEP